jgi:alcohol dehydrogenase
VIRFNGPVAEALLAELVGDPGPAADTLASRVAAMARTAALPETLRECGVAEGILPLLADEANQQWTARFNPRPVTEADLLRLYQAAW